MAADYIAVDQNVSLNSPILFQDVTPCNQGCVYHENGSGVFVLRGKTRNCFAKYSVTFTGNIAIPEGSTPGPIAVSISLYGEQRAGSRAIYTPTVADAYGNVTSKATFRVPAGCCFAMAVEYVNGNTDATAVPAPSINVNGQLSVERVS